MRSLLLVLLAATVTLWGQSTSQSPASSKSQAPDEPSSTSSTAPTAGNPKLTPPRSDRVNAKDLGEDSGESSSKSTQIDLSPPADDAKAHPRSSDVLMDEGSGDAGEVHPWDPHRAAKDVEVGDFYFKRKNYHAAESRYREALYYKDNDALATYRLAECLEKMNQPEDARMEYESYLKILPNGPQAEGARKAIERLKGPSDTKAAK